jgi:AGCS family alanine or glycine:cation symporter
MMYEIFRINGIVNGIVWGPWMLSLLVGTGIYLTIILGWPQFRYFTTFWKEVLSMRKGSTGPGDKSISSFAAMAVAMSATLGVGNIAGVATALHLGGPGATFWMITSAFFGMTTKFGEIVLATHFRQKDADGDWRGGTMYIMEHGANKKWLAVLFALFAFLACFGIGAAVQANAVAEGLQMGFGISHMVSGVLLVILVGLVIIGGLQTLATVASYIIPGMAVFYIVGCSVVVLLNSHLVMGALGQVVQGAFTNPMAIPGAIAGWTVAGAIRRGIARGVFSNEAGLGSAPMVHCASNIDHPVRQGLYGLFEVFIDTIINILTTLTILTTLALTTQVQLADGSWGYNSGARLALFAFETGLGPFGVYTLSLALVLFAYTTILGWYWYGESALVYLVGVKAKLPFKAVYLVAVLLGAAGAAIFGTDAKNILDNVWDIADTLNAFMAIPNLIGLLILSGVIKKIVGDFDEKRKSGELKI